MNVTTCIFASPIFKYIYYLILYQWQLYIHVRSTILFSFFFFGRRLSSSASTIRVNFIPIWWDIINNIKALAIMIFALPKFFIRDCLNSRSAQNDSDIVAWWSGNAISRKGRPRCLWTAGPNFINSKFKNNFCETQHVFTRTTLEWVAHNFFLSNLFDCFY